MGSEDIVPFEVNIPKEEVERLHRKLADTRLPPKPIVPDAGDKYGPPYEWGQKLFEAWKTDFDWYSKQAQMNEYPNYHTQVDELNIHFVHARAEKKDAIPLLMVHGWPGSFYEFSSVWGPLSHPEDSSAQAFHVVVPSLPGFGFSSWPPRAGWTLQDTAACYHKLMLRLGYKEYMIQCGDWGHWIGRELGSQAKYKDANGCRLVHCNFAPSALPEGVEYTQRETEVKNRVADWLDNHMGYAVQMRTRPHTIGFGFHDNPLAILMWVGEKYLEASCPTNQAKPYWTQAILTTASLYFFTGTIMPSMLCYYENVRHENFAAKALEPQNRISVPFGYTSFWWDTEPASKRAVERTGNLVFYEENDEGGHYAALECPSAIIGGVRGLAKQEWGKW